MADVIPVGAHAGVQCYELTTTVAITGGATQNIPITALPNGLYIVYGTIVATGLDAAATTVAVQPFIDSAGSVETAGQEFLHVTGAGIAGRSVAITTFPAVNLHFNLASSNATVPCFEIPIMFGPRLQVVRGATTTGSLLITLIFKR